MAADGEENEIRLDVRPRNWLQWCRDDLGLWLIGLFLIGLAIIVLSRRRENAGSLWGAFACGALGLTLVAAAAAHMRASYRETRGPARLTLRGGALRCERPGRRVMTVDLNRLTSVDLWGQKRQRMLTIRFADGLSSDLLSEKLFRSEDLGATLKTLQRELDSRRAAPVRFPVFAIPTTSGEPSSRRQVGGDGPLPYEPPASPWTLRYVVESDGFRLYFPVEKPVPKAISIAIGATVFFGLLYWILSVRTVAGYVVGLAIGGFGVFAASGTVNDIRFPKEPIFVSLRGGLLTVTEPDRKRPKVREFDLMHFVGVSLVKKQVGENEVNTLALHPRRGESQEIGLITPEQAEEDLKVLAGFIRDALNRIHSRTLPAGKPELEKQHG